MISKSKIVKSKEDMDASDKKDISIYSVIPMEIRGSKPYTDKCIIFDLDETLIHTQDPEKKNYFNLLDEILDNPQLIDLRARTYRYVLEDVLDKKGSGSLSDIWGITRPHYKDFLIFCYRYFKIVGFWSAGQPLYVHEIVDHITRDLPKPHVVFTYDDCEKLENDQLVKPLTKMMKSNSFLESHMDLKNTFILDDRKGTTYFNEGNGIIIPPYEAQETKESLVKDDQALNQLKDWLLLPKVRRSTDVSILDKSNIFDRKSFPDQEVR